MRSKPNGKFEGLSQDGGTTGVGSIVSGRRGPRPIPVARGHMMLALLWGKLICDSGRESSSGAEEFQSESERKGKPNMATFASSEVVPQGSCLLSEP